ncbi:unnamed protein product [Laminaria digitata]
MHRRLKLRHAFPKAADEYTKPVERILQLRRADMDEEWAKLEEGWAAINERMAEVGLSPRTDNESVVELNVGGSKVTVSWHLLSRTEGFESSTLGALLEGVWGKERVPRSADGCMVLDESTTCIKHIFNAVLTGRGAESSAVAIDEAPCHIYTACVMGLPGSMPTHPNYVKVNGGSAILEPFEIAPFSAKLREWVGGSTVEMTLIYRATRDGFGGEAFMARCTQHSPRTISLIRVSSGQGNDDDDDSIVGGFSSVAWGRAVGSRQQATADVFVFMLKDGDSATREDVNVPTKMDGNGRQHDFFATPRSDGLFFGTGDLLTNFDEESGSCTIQTGQHHYRTGSNAPFLALNGNNIIEIEVYHYSNKTPPTIAPDAIELDEDALGEAEAPDVHSFGQSIASSLMEERVILDRAVKEMEAAGARVSAAVEALETVYGPSVAAGEQDAVVELNVRGTMMTTLRSTLRACPRSALAAMFNEDRWPATDKDKDQDGGRLIDCNPVCFSKILDVLRMRKRDSWSQGVTPEKQEGASGKCSGAILIKKADLKAFRIAVEMYFPGCESFIMGLCSVHTTPAA